jgi:hypothetical protein
MGLSIYYAIYIRSFASGNTVTVNVPGGASELMIAEYAGLSTVSPLDVVASGSGDGDPFTESASTASVSTTNAHDVLIAADISGAGTNAPGPGYTTRLLPGDIFEDQIVTQKGSYSASASLNGLSNSCSSTPSYPFVMQMIAFRVAQ